MAALVTTDTTISNPHFHVFSTMAEFLRGWSPRTVHCYQHALATFSPERITKQSIPQFVLDLQPRGHNPGGIHLIQRALNSFLTWAHEQAIPTSTISIAAQTSQSTSQP